MNFLPNDPRDVDNVTQDSFTPDHWEDRAHSPARPNRRTAPKTKVRKPVTVKNWFGLDSSSNEESEEDDSCWTDVDRKKKRQERKKISDIRKNKLKEECSSRAAHMASLGPITTETVNYFKTDGVSFEDAKILAVKEFLACQLEYDEDELKEIDIVETRISTRGDDILSIALADENHIKELYMRKAELKRDEITIRSYIPPNFFERYMALNRIASDKRNNDPDLRTQLRFGNKDIEIYVKYLNEETGYKRISITDFTDLEIPPFDSNISWKRYTDRLPRKVIDKPTAPKSRPSMVGQVQKAKRGPQIHSAHPPSGLPPQRKEQETQQLKRANSNTTTSASKKDKLNADSSDDQEMGDYEKDPLDDTPSSQNSSNN